MSTMFEILLRATTLDPSQAEHAAKELQAAGYGKQVEQEDMTVYGYCVVDREGKFIKDCRQNQQEAIDFAASSTKDCQDMGIDWDYRVAAIVDQGGL